MMLCCFVVRLSTAHDKDGLAPAVLQILPRLMRGVYFGYLPQYMNAGLTGEHSKVEICQLTFNSD